VALRILRFSLLHGAAALHLRLRLFGHFLGAHAQQVVLEIGREGEIFRHVEHREITANVASGAQ